MNIQLKDTLTNELINAKIVKANADDMPPKKEGWDFSWKQLYRKGGNIYKVVLSEQSQEVEGLLKISVENREQVIMDFVEVALKSYGSNGRYDYVAGCLIAYGCKLSFELGKGYYKGFLTFTSKTTLIEHYEKKYGAIRAVGQRMFIDPENGRKLIKKYLSIEVK